MFGSERQAYELNRSCDSARHQPPEPLNEVKQNNFLRIKRWCEIITSRDIQATTCLAVTSAKLARFVFLTQVP